MCDCITLEEVDWEIWDVGEADGAALNEGLKLIRGELEQEGALLNVGGCEGWGLGVSGAEGN